MERNEKAFVLPESVASPMEVARLEREVDELNQFMGQAKIRKGEDAKLPTPTKLLHDISEANSLNLLQERDRELLYNRLAVVKQQAPLIHMSFAANPSMAFMKKLVAWLREEIHPYALVTIGLQPSLGAGCMVRTNNRYFDFSLRQHLEKQRELLTQKLANISGSQEPAANG